MDYPDGATPLDPDEMEGLKHPHIQTRDELNELEQYNIQEGYVWLSRQRKFKDFLTEEFIKELHKKLFGSVWSWAGKFRQSDKNIGVDHFVIGVELRNLLDDTNYWVENGTFGREEFAARFHHRLDSQKLIGVRILWQKMEKIDNDISKHCVQQINMITTL